MREPTQGRTRGTYARRRTDDPDFGTARGTTTCAPPSRKRTPPSRPHLPHPRETTSEREALVEVPLAHLTRRIEGRPPRNVVDKRRGYVIDETHLA
ncbi:hypothetical protein [Streptomyces canus]|uniref:hypothetical protein n=1 Tax=Streptomyces canus TaxID=58343 RepID=UPI0036F0CE49